MSLKSRLQSDVNSALRAGDKQRVAVLRLALAAVKQREVDTRQELGESDVQAVITKLIKQGRDAAAQFAAGGRADLARKEEAEVSCLEGYLPAQLSESELRELIDDVLLETGATSTKDMGKVMKTIRARAAGPVDMALVNSVVKAALSSSR
jgi:uncharacterized protein YqeY